MEQERFYFGQILDTPQVIFTQPIKNKQGDIVGALMGIHCKIQTNSTETGDPVVLDTRIEFDIFKYKMIQPNEMVKLSFKSVLASKTSPSGRRYKFSVVERR